MKQRQKMLDRLAKKKMQLEQSEAKVSPQDIAELEKQTNLDIQEFNKTINEEESSALQRLLIMKEICTI